MTCAQPPVILACPIILLYKIYFLLGRFCSILIKIRPQTPIWKCCSLRAPHLTRILLLDILLQKLHETHEQNSHAFYHWFTLGQKIILGNSTRTPGGPLTPLSKSWAHTTICSVTTVQHIRTTDHIISITQINSSTSMDKHCYPWKVSVSVLASAVHWCWIKTKVCITHNQPAQIWVMRDVSKLRLSLQDCVKEAMRCL